MGLLSEAEVAELDRIGGEDRGWNWNLSVQAIAHWIHQKCQPLVCEEACFLWGHSHSKWKPTHALDWFFQLWKRPLNIPRLAYHKSRIPSIMMMIMALVIATLQLLLSLMHLQSLLGVGGVLRIVLLPAFKNSATAAQSADQSEPHKVGSCLSNGLTVVTARCEGRKRGLLSVLWVQEGDTLEPGPGGDSCKLWHSDEPCCQPPPMSWLLWPALSCK